MIDERILFETLSLERSSAGMGSRTRAIFDMIRPNPLPLLTYSFPSLVITISYLPFRLVGCEIVADWVSRDSSSSVGVGIVETIKLL